jgi:hypothetical protein
LTCTENHGLLFRQKLTESINVVYNDKYLLLGWHLPTRDLKWHTAISI